MKHLIFAVIFLSSTFSMAAPATTYECVGIDQVSGESVVFELLFGSYGSNEGYTDQSITIEKQGGVALDEKLVFQMYNATKSNQCKRSPVNEIYLAGDFEMIPTENGNISAYQVNFKSPCADAKYDVQAYCFFQ